MSIVIFVGGSTACGKSTFVNELNVNIPNSRKYRRYQGFFDIATKDKIPNEKIFEQVTSESVDDWFVNICKESEVVISDVHYAVQMNRNSAITNQQGNMDIYQEYVPTISQELLQKLTEANIKIIAVYLSCSPEVCLIRGINRYNETKKELRAISLEDARLESRAEKQEWNNIISSNLVDGIELNSEQFSTHDLINQYLRCFNNLFDKSKKYQLIKKS